MYIDFGGLKLQKSIGYKQPATRQRREEQRIMKRIDELSRRRCGATFNDGIDPYNTLIYTRKKPLSIKALKTINARIAVLYNLAKDSKAARHNRAVITVTYFVPCRDDDLLYSQGKGVYKTVTGMCWRVDVDTRQTITIGRTEIPIVNIASIESKDPDQFKGQNKAFHKFIEDHDFFWGAF